MEIPNKAKLDIVETDIPNLASNEEIAEKMVAAVCDYENRFTTQREEWAADTDGLWNQMDAAFRSFINDNTVQNLKAVGANEPDTWERAKVGTTQFYRQVTQKAANGYAIQTTKEMPFEYQPLHDGLDDRDFAEERAKKMNLLAKWSLKKDRFSRKSIEFWNQVRKYGNVPVMVEWVRREGKKEIRVPVFDKDDPSKISDYDFIEVEAVLENHPRTTILPVESVYADTMIGNLQDQDCVIVATLVGLSEIVSGVKDGYYRDDLLELLQESHRWDGVSGRENIDEKAENRGFSSGQAMQTTGKYMKREIFINVPVDLKKKKWDEEKNVPLRYRVTMFGNKPDTSVIARIERNQEPDDSIPIEMIHANPDDSDYLYHISDYEVIRPNLSTETTLVRQVIDNNTLVCKPAIIEERGAVDGLNRAFGPNARFVADSVNSIREFTTRDISGVTLGILEYMKDDSNTALGIDKNMLGESWGARTTAQEVGVISSNTARPNLVNIEYILDQYLTFVAERYKVGWENYGIKEQVVQITDENGELVFIRPSEIYGEFDIVINIMDDIKDEAIESNKLIGFAQTVGAIPQMSEQIDWKDLTAELAEKIMKTSRFVVGPDDMDAVQNAMKNVAMVLNSGVMPNIHAGMNLRKHLEVYRKERKRWEGYEDQNENIGMLDELISTAEQAMKGGMYGAIGPGSLQNISSEPVISAGEQRRQEISGAAGGF